MHEINMLVAAICLYRFVTFPGNSVGVFCFQARQLLQLRSQLVLVLWDTVGPRALTLTP